MSEHPLFMSIQHVEILNRRLSEADSVKELCAKLERDLSLLYDMTGGPDGAAVYWRTDFSRVDGARFSLERGIGAPDVAITGSYWDVLDALQGQSAMPAPQGGADDIGTIMGLLSSNEMKQCAVPVTWPTQAKNTVPDILGT